MLPLRLSEIAELVGGKLVGAADPELVGAAGLAEAGAGDLSFVAEARHLAAARASAAGALLVAPDMTVDKPHVRVEDPYRAFAKVLAGLAIDLDRAFPPGVDRTAVIDPTADVSAAASIGPCCVVGAGAVIGGGTRLGPHVVIGCDVVLGAQCIVYPQAVIREGCRLGDRVVVHAAVVIGGDGFGYRPGRAGLEKVPQVGIVEIESDVEIGAGSTIDRATTGRTVIGAGSKLDNQVQIAHNVKVGRHCALSAQTGVAGSAVLGDGVVCGGQVGIGDHVTIGDGCQIGGQTGVIGNLPPGSRVFGTPSQDVKKSLRTTAAVRRLPDLQDVVQELKRKIAALEARLDGAPETESAAEPDRES